MKIKKLWVGLIDRNDIDRIVVVREASFIKKIVKLSLNDNDDEYRCVFTNKPYWFKRGDIEPFVNFLSIDQLKKRIGKRTIREVYKEKENAMRKQLTKKSKPVMGIRSE